MSVNAQSRPHFVRNNVCVRMWNIPIHWCLACQSGAWPLLDVETSSSNCSDLMDSGHGAGTKQFNGSGSLSLPPSPVGLSPHTHCPHKVSDNICLLHKITTHSSFSSKLGQNIPQGWTPVQQEVMLFARGSSNL